MTERAGGYSKVTKIKTIFTEATLLCLLLNKPHLFSLTKQRLIVIQLVTLTCTLHVSTWIYAILRHAVEKPYEGR